MPTVTNEQGGSQSFIEADFDCIPPEVLKLLAECLGFGARKYGKFNWKKIPIEDNLSHAMNHINEWRRGDRTEPHLVNAMARLTFALWHAVNSGDQPERYIHPDMIAAEKEQEITALAEAVKQLDRRGMSYRVRNGEIYAKEPIPEYTPVTLESAKSLEQFNFTKKENQNDPTR